MSSGESSVHLLYDMEMELEDALHHPYLDNFDQVAGGNEPTSTNHTEVEGFDAIAAAVDWMIYSQNIVEFLNQDYFATSIQDPFSDNSRVPVDSPLNANNHEMIYISEVNATRLEEDDEECPFGFLIDIGAYHSVISRKEV